MGMKILFLGGYRDVDETVYGSASVYHQGYPLKMRTDHTVDWCKIHTLDVDSGYLGLALNFAGSTTDKKSDLYNGKAAYLAGPNKVKLDAGNENDTTDTYPYDTTKTYDEGQELYVDTNGKLSNDAPGVGVVPAASLPVATIVEVGALQVYLVAKMLAN